MYRLPQHEVNELLKAYQMHMIANKSDQFNMIIKNTSHMQNQSHDGQLNKGQVGINNLSLNLSNAKGKRKRTNQIENNAKTRCVLPTIPEEPASPSKILKLLEKTTSYYDNVYCL